MCMVRKIYCIGPSKLATIPLYNPLKSHVGVHVHKITYGPLIVTTVYVMLLMRANPLLGQVAEGWALDIEIFLGPVNWHRAVRRVPFVPKKVCGL